MVVEEWGDCAMAYVLLMFGRFRYLFDEVSGKGGRLKF